MSADAQLLVVFGTLHLVGIVLATGMFVMLLRADTVMPARPPADGDDDGGGGGRRPDLPTPPRPRGGLEIPLRDSAPARARLREPGRLADLVPRRGRRPQHPPRPRRAPQRL